MRIQLKINKSAPQGRKYKLYSDSLQGHPCSHWSKISQYGGGGGGSLLVPAWERQNGRWPAWETCPMSVPKNPLNRFFFKRDILCILKLRFPLGGFFLQCGQRCSIKSRESRIRTEQKSTMRMRQLDERAPSAR